VEPRDPRTKRPAARPDAEEDLDAEPETRGFDVPRDLAAEARSSSSPPGRKDVGATRAVSIPPDVLAEARRALGDSEAASPTPPDATREVDVPLATLEALRLTAPHDDEVQGATYDARSRSAESEALLEDELAHDELTAPARRTPPAVGRGAPPTARVAMALVAGVVLLAALIYFIGR